MIREFSSCFLVESRVDGRAAQVDDRVRTNERGFINLAFIRVPRVLVLALGVAAHEARTVWPPVVSRAETCWPTMPDAPAMTMVCGATSA